LVRGYADEVREKLIAAGCRRLRSGKGDHEIWVCPASPRPFPVDSRIMSRHMANAVLKQAGIKGKID
jgi:hypothetical protein